MHGGGVADIHPRGNRGPTGGGNRVGRRLSRILVEIGDHDVILAGPGERLVLSHVAEDRAIFAHGAIAAARWGQGKKPGLYGITDVLGLSDA